MVTITPDKDDYDWIKWRTDDRLVQNSEDQLRDEHGRWLSLAAGGGTTHGEIDAAGLPERTSASAHEALGRHERGEEIGRIAREGAAQPQRAMPTEPIQLKPVQAAPRAEGTKASPLPEGSHGDVLRELYSRTGRLQTTYDQIDEHVAHLRRLPASDAIQAAREMGVEEHNLTTRDRAVRRVERMLVARLGHAERGAEVGAVARTQK